MPDVVERTVQAELLDSLEELRDLKPNWNGYGAAPIDPETLAAAKRFTHALPNDVTTAPIVVPMTSGRLQFEWDVRDRHLEVEFGTSQTVHTLRWCNDRSVDEESTLPDNDDASLHDMIRWTLSGNGDV